MLEIGGINVSSMENIRLRLKIQQRYQKTLLNRLLFTIHHVPHVSQIYSVVNSIAIELTQLQMCDFIRI